MNPDHASYTNDLTLSFKEATAPEVNGPSRFAKALKQARFARGWTQEDLAEKVPTPKRAIVSWETAERIPSMGMVVLLLNTLTLEDELSLHHELITAYIADDLERQGQRKDQKSPFLQRVQRVRERVLQLPERSTRAEPDTRVAEEPSASTPTSVHDLPQKTNELERLLALLIRLQRHPDLIAVADDFIRELAPRETLP